MHHTYMYKHKSYDVYTIDEPHLNANKQTKEKGKQRHEKEHTLRNIDVI